MCARGRHPPKLAAPGSHISSTYLVSPAHPGSSLKSPSHKSRLPPTRPVSLKAWVALRRPLSYTATSEAQWSAPLLEIFLVDLLRNVQNNEHR